MVALALAINEGRMSMLFFIGGVDWLGAQELRLVHLQVQQSWRFTMWVATGTRRCRSFMLNLTSPGIQIVHKSYLVKNVIHVFAIDMKK